MATGLNYNEVGKRIRSYRESRRMQAGDIATTLKWPVEHIARIEEGLYVMSLPELVALCDVVSCMPEQILYGKDDLKRKVLRYEFMEIAYRLDPVTVEILKDVFNTIFPKK